MKRALQMLVGIAVASAINMGGVALAATLPPTVTTGGASSVTDNGAVLHGTVNPNGSATTYHFEWGLTTTYGSSGAVKSAGAGTKPVAASEPATRLTPGTTYHYRLVAVNQSGPPVDGADQTFQTTPAPVVSTGQATDLSASGAELTGVVNPSGQTTTWYFQWGVNSLTEQTPPRTLPASAPPQNVLWSLRGLLRPGTIYRYRLVAVHQSSHPVDGVIQTFMTYPPGPSFTRLIARTRPRHARRRPYTFLTSGVLVHPYWIPAKYVCMGEITIEFFHRHHRARYNTATVQRDCRFSAVTAFHRLPGHGRWRRPVHLRVVVRFLPTPYLGSSRARTERVTVG